MLAVVVHGAAGRMGRAVARLVREADDLRLAAEVDRAEGFAHDLGEALRGAGVLIDFSSPEGAARAAGRCEAAGVPMVTGTTGLSEAQRAALAEAARRVAVVAAPNLSVGVNVSYRLVAAARAALGEAFTPAIVETHHAAKQDAPSGTALRLGEIAGCPPDRIVSVRGGDVVGDHTVLFLGPMERIEITHRAHSRDVFALGALRAARWVVGRPAGLYGLSDVLGTGSP